MAGTLVSCDWSNYRDTQCDMSVTGCEHISHSTFKILYLRSEKWESRKIWHEHPYMTFLNGQKRKSFEIQSNVPFFWFSQSFSKKSSKWVIKKNIKSCKFTI